MTSGRGELGSGNAVVRASPGNSRNYGFSPDYLSALEEPGALVSGATRDNAWGICQAGITRADPLHVHFGRMIDGRPHGVRPGSDVSIDIDANM